MVCNSPIVDPHMKTPKPDHINQPQKPSKRTPISTCQQSQSAWIDLAILIAVIAAFGFLIHPTANLLAHQTLHLLQTTIPMVKSELLAAPMIYGCLGLSIFTASTAVLTATLCTRRQKCGKPGCRGRQKAAEFDIQLETEDCVHTSNPSGGLKNGLFELPRDYHRELEAELKKMAPVNGRAVLVFRARCGCSVGRMEVPGPKKNSRKVKK